MSLCCHSVSVLHFSPYDFQKIKTSFKKSVFRREELRKVEKTTFRVMHSLHCSKKYFFLSCTRFIARKSIFSCYALASLLEKTFFLAMHSLHCSKKHFFLSCTRFIAQKSIFSYRALASLLKKAYCRRYKKIIALSARQRRLQGFFLLRSRRKALNSPIQRTARYCFC